ncbi:hypothetical protein CTI12_AA105290 [Artemisia annua]|uniref:Uncharacterized protein n=1 Tax=Artemisia annua TaxID=35608 RepID=A0A2U1PWC2_ARTAN|nr:hypothetical protein CTI12_AA105290 [Artemisia annua]
METPLSSRRITRSQAKSMSSRCENDESLKGVSKSAQKKGKHQEKEKSALIDITNGSPIVGLAMGSLKTPGSKKGVMMSKRAVTTPGSGESLLRGQVKTLLQRVEEEGVIPKISFDHTSLNYKRFVNSPMAILAPTPANTPQVYDFSTNKGLESFTVSPVAENFNFTKMLNEIIAAPNQEEKDETARTLFMDFSEKSQDSDVSECNSVLTCEGSDVSGASMWSVQVNPSTSDECKGDTHNEDYEDVGDEGLDKLCEEMSKISVNNATAKFAGKHTRFVYNSDGELEGELSSSSKTEEEIVV